MTWDGKKVLYKTGKGGQGQGIGTVLFDAGSKVRIRTLKGKEITRSVGSIIGPVEEATPALTEASEQQMSTI